MSASTYYWTDNELAFSQVAMETQFEYRSNKVTNKNKKCVVLVCVDHSNPTLTLKPPDSNKSRYFTVRAAWTLCYKLYFQKT